MTGDRSKDLGRVFKPGQKWYSGEVLKGELGTEQGRRELWVFS